MGTSVSLAAPILWEFQGSGLLQEHGSLTAGGTATLSFFGGRAAGWPYFVFSVVLPKELHEGNVLRTYPKLSLSHRAHIYHYTLFLNREDGGVTAKGSYSH